MGRKERVGLGAFEPQFSAILILGTGNLFPHSLSDGLALSS